MAERIRAGHRKLGAKIRPVAAGLPALSGICVQAHGYDQTGKRIAYRVLATRDEKEAQAFVKEYPVGAKVKVTYNTADPQNSVLEPGPEGTKVLTHDVIWAFCTGTFVLLVTLLL